MLELAADQRLPDQAADQGGLLAEVSTQAHDRDVAAQVGVAALEDGRPCRRVISPSMR